MIGMALNLAMASTDGMNKSMTVASASGSTSETENAQIELTLKNIDKADIIQNGAPPKILLSRWFCGGYSEDVPVETWRIANSDVIVEYNGSTAKVRIKSLSKTVRSGDMISGHLMAPFAQIGFPPTRVGGEGMTLRYFRNGYNAVQHLYYIEGRIDGRGGQGYGFANYWKLRCLDANFNVVNEFTATDAPYTSDYVIPTFQSSTPIEIGANVAYAQIINTYYPRYAWVDTSNIIPFTPS